MSRISDKFRKLKSHDDKALITYIMAGDPSLDVTEDLIYALEEGGADIIELGVPFSDPLADGPVIQRASERAIKSGTNLVKVFNLVNKVRKRTQIPIVIMTYYNIIFKYDERSFVKDAVRCGVDGVIVPDLPPEEGKNLIEFSREEGLDTIFLLAPTSNEKRIALASKKSRGFIYYVSLTGTTGMRSGLSRTISPMTKVIKRQTSKPVAVGFGISNAAQAAEAASFSDGVVIGSAIVRIIEESAFQGNTLNAVRDFVNEIKRGIRHNIDSFDENRKMLEDYLVEKI